MAVLRKTCCPEALVSNALVALGEFAAVIRLGPSGPAAAFPAMRFIGPLAHHPLVAAFRAIRYAGCPGCNRRVRSPTVKTAWRICGA